MLKVSLLRQFKSFMSTVTFPTKTFFKGVLKLLHPKALGQTKVSFGIRLHSANTQVNTGVEQLVSQHHTAFFWNEFFPYWLKHVIPSLVMLEHLVLSSCNFWIKF